MQRDGKTEAEIRDSTPAVNSQKAGQPPIDGPQTREDDPSRSERIKIQNRRLRYLELHPEYFSSPHLELADPLLHDRLIARFLSPAERTAARQSRPFGETLEAQLQRVEARLAHISHSSDEAPQQQRQTTTTALGGGDESDDFVFIRPDSGGGGPAADVIGDIDSTGVALGAGGRLRGSTGANVGGGIEVFAVEREASERAGSQEEGLERWKRVMGERFTKGLDEEFDYEGLVDGNDSLDDGREGESEVERWMEDENAVFDWVPEGGLKGETGVQDF